MLENITKQEIDIMNSWHDSRSLIECLFSDFDNLSEFDENKNGELRLYQLPLIDHSSLINFSMTAEHHKMSRKEEFDMRKKVGDVTAISSRGIGKTMCVQKLSVPLSLLHDKGMWCGFSASDSIHLSVLTDTIISAIENHPILRQFKVRTKSSHPILITGKSGWKLDGVNENVKSKSPGHQFFGKHFHKLYIEEISLESHKASEARHDAVSDFGAITRITGMCNFVKNTPADKAFNEKDKLFNIPQYSKPEWSEEEADEKAKLYGGKEAPLYKIFVDGEVIDDGIAEIDMERVEECYNLKKKIKRFELRKEQFKNYRKKIIVEKPKNCDRIFIASDIGDGKGGSDISIFAEYGQKYKYIYNIALYKHKLDEQIEIFNYLIEQTDANVVAIDCGDAFGRNLADALSKIYPKENIVRYSGNTKVTVGFEEDSKGNIIYKDGKPLVREEFMSEWSVRRLKTLLYENRIEIPRDDKLDNQLSQVISTISGTRVIFACTSDTGDHLFDGFRIFAIAQWLKKDFNQTKPMNNDWVVGATSITVGNKRKERNRKLHIKDYIYRGVPVDCGSKEEYEFILKTLEEYREELQKSNDREKINFLNKQIEILTKKFK